MAVLEAEILGEIAPKLLTYKQYLSEFLTEPVTTRPCDIVDGVRIYMTSPNWTHQQISFALATLLQQYRITHGGQVAQAPLDVLIDSATLRVRQPDVLYISSERFRRGGGAPDLGPLTIAPELVVEILSPSETRRILNAKIADFCAIGINECWVVSPQGESVEVLRLTSEGPVREALYGLGQMLQSITFPDLTLALDEIFRMEE